LSGLEERLPQRHRHRLLPLAPREPLDRVELASDVDSGWSGDADSAAPIVRGALEAREGSEAVTRLVHAIKRTVLRRRSGEIAPGATLFESLRCFFFRVSVTREKTHETPQ